MPLPAVIAGASLIGAGAQIISGNKAAKAQQDASNAQIAESRRQYDQDRADLAPWRTTGGAAMAKIGSLYGLDGSTPNNTGTGTDAYGGFFESPDYQYRKDQSLKALDRYQSARGILNSGATRVAAERTAGDMASSEYGNWFNRLANIAGAGQSAVGTGIDAGRTATNSINNATQNAGNARASSYLNTGSAINSGINNVMQAYLYKGGVGSVPGYSNPYAPKSWGG